MKKLVFAIACLLPLSAVYAATPGVGGPGSASVVIVADTVNLTQYVGKYKFQGLPFDYITIAVKDGKLTINTGTEEGVLTPLKDADSFDAAGRAILKFTRNPDKKVTGVMLEAEQMAFEGKKEA
jgi:hypothetical protein